MSADWGGERRSPLRGNCPRTEPRSATWRLALLLLAFLLLFGCSEDEPWWADDVRASPCTLEMRSAVEQALGNRQVTEEALALDTGYHCAFSLGEDHDDVRIQVFRPIAQDAEWAENLDNSSLWTPLAEVGDAAGYQSYWANGTAQVFMRSVKSDVGVAIDVITEGSLEHGIDVASKIGNEVFDRMEKRRPR